jgi:hypothetical protein
MRNDGRGGSEGGAIEEARPRSSALSASNKGIGTGWRLYLGALADVQGPIGGVEKTIFTAVKKRVVVMRNIRVSRKMVKLR